MSYRLYPFVLIAIWSCPTGGAFCDEARIQELAPSKPPRAIRVATFNVSLNRSEPGQLTKDLLSGSDPQCRALATVIRSVQPDILLLNEVDYSTEADNAGLFHDHYLSDSSSDLLGGSAWNMPFRFSTESNTGLASQLDLNRNGKIDDPEDAWGFGRFPGQYAMAVLSRYEIDLDATRTFQKLLWSDLPDALEPAFPDTGEKYYTPEIWKQLRLPSKSLWDVVIKIPQGPLHLLASHPTPPVFDGPEDRNGCRNHDEIRLLLEYISGDSLTAASGRWLEFWQDDRGRTGALASNALFVIAGDLNCDPHDGDSRREALVRLLEHPRVQSEPIPASQGAVQAARTQGKKNLSHHGDPQYDTGDFNDNAVGNLRIDYVLPSSGLKVIQAGVVWPELPEGDAELSDLLKRLDEASDHHLVWVDLQPHQQN